MWSVCVLGEIRCARSSTLIGINIIIHFSDTTWGEFRRQTSVYTEPYKGIEKRGLASDKGDVDRIIYWC
jgi:hypothetical protein